LFIKCLCLITALCFLILLNIKNAKAINKTIINPLTKLSFAPSSPNIARPVALLLPKTIFSWTNAEYVSEFKFTSRLNSPSSSSLIGIIVSNSFSDPAEICFASLTSASFLLSRSKIKNCNSTSWLLPTSSFIAYLTLTLPSSSLSTLINLKSICLPVTSTKSMAVSFNSLHFSKISKGYSPTSRFSGILTSKTKTYSSPAAKPLAPVLGTQEAYSPWLLNKQSLRKTVPLFLTFQLETFFTPPWLITISEMLPASMLFLEIMPPPPELPPELPPPSLPPEGGAEVSTVKLELLFVK